MPKILFEALDQAYSMAFGTGAAVIIIRKELLSISS